MESENAVQLSDPEAEFLASNTESGHEWEMFKENVRPLKRGRDVRLLNQTLKSHSDSQIKNSIIQQRRRLIEAIDDYRGEDPLLPWLQCIKWVQEAFPTGGDCSGLVVIYEQCVCTFWHDDRYKDDLRFLKVWLEYAENCADAEIIYKFLEANKIGITQALFYISYAMHLQSKNKTKTADEIFNRGISLNAEPVEKLKAAYTKFLHHSMRQLKPTEDDASSTKPHRCFGTVLSREVNHNIEPRDLFGKKQKLGRSSGSISIFEEKGSDHDPGSSSMFFQSETDTIKPFRSALGPRAERNKENNPIPSKWTSYKIPHKPGQRRLPPPVPGIDILEDEEVAVSKETNEGKKMSLRAGDLKGETEMLRKNPLRNFPPSSLPR